MSLSPTTQSPLGALESTDLTWHSVTIEMNDSDLGLTFRPTDPRWAQLFQVSLAAWEQHSPLFKVLDISFPVSSNGKEDSMKFKMPTLVNGTLETINIHSATPPQTLWILGTLMRKSVTKIQLPDRPFGKLRKVLSQHTQLKEITIERPDGRASIDEARDDGFINFVLSNWEHLLVLRIEDVAIEDLNTLTGLSELRDLRFRAPIPSAQRGNEPMKTYHFPNLQALHIKASEASHCIASMNGIQQGPKRLTFEVDGYVSSEGWHNCFEAINKWNMGITHLTFIDCVDFGANTRTPAPEVSQRTINLGILEPLLSLNDLTVLRFRVTCLFGLANQDFQKMKWPKLECLSMQTIQGFSHRSIGSEIDPRAEWDPQITYDGLLGFSYNLPALKDLVFSSALDDAEIEESNDLTLLFPKVKKVQIFQRNPRSTGVLKKFEIAKSRIFDKY